MPRVVQQNSADLNVVQEENGGRGYEVYNQSAEWDCRISAECDSFSEK